MAESSSRPVTTPAAPGLVMAWLEAAGLLTLVQAALLLDRYRALAEPGGSGPRLIGLATLAAVGTLLALSPLLLLTPWLRGGIEGWRLPWALAMATAVWVAVELLAAPGSSPANLLFHGLLALLGLVAGVVTVPRRPLSRGLFRGVLLLGAALGLVGILSSTGQPDGEAGGPDDPDGSPSTRHQPDSEPRPDVVLITIDTLRADHLGVYGRSPSPTPAIDQLAAEGVRFENAQASSPWTVPSIASLMTGLPTLEHGAGLPLAAGQTFLRTALAAEQRTLAERFTRAGYRTAAVVANAFLGRSRGLAQGFASYENPWLDASRAGVWLDLPFTRWLVRQLPAEGFGDPRARGVVDRALALLTDDDPRPLFLWLHLIDPHAPYQADPDRLEIVNVVEELAADPRPGPDGNVVGERFVHAHQVRSGVLWLGPDDRRRIESYYERGVAYADQHLGRLFDALRQRSRERPVIAALTADHGEEFWDHGHFEHGHDYYREVLQVPAILWAPGRLPAATVITEPIGLVDLGPTLLELAGLAVGDGSPAWWQGWSLAGLWGAGEKPDIPPRLAGGNLYGLPAVSLADGPWRYILRANGSDELYHLPSDRAERHNVRFLQPEVAARYRRLLEPRLAAHLALESGQARALDPTDREGLRSLGYVQ